MREMGRIGGIRGTGNKHTESNIVGSPSIHTVGVLDIAETDIGLLAWWVEVCSVDVVVLVQDVLASHDDRSPELRLDNGPICLSALILLIRLF